jgi:transcriptional repressor BetI
LCRQLNLLGPISIARIGCGLSLLNLTGTIPLNRWIGELPRRPSLLQRSPLNAGSKKGRFALVVSDGGRLALSVKLLERYPLAREEHAMWHSNVLLRDGVIRLMQQARTPDERLWAIVEGNFSTEFFTPLICNAWLALCAEVPPDPQIPRIQRVVHARMRSNLISALSALVPPEQCQTVALGISSLIDGLWLRFGLHPSELSAAEALAQMADYLGHRIRI